MTPKPVPVFELCADDPLAPQLVKIWAAVEKLAAGDDSPAAAQAEEVYKQMSAYQEEHHIHEFPILDVILEVFSNDN